MAGTLPPIPPNYVPIFESYWLQLEGSSSGDVNAITAASFLKKSQLKESLLHKIWDLSDPCGKGYLDKQGFFVALRLVAACQCGRDPSLKSIQAIDPPPKFVGLEPTAWSIDANERAMYNTRFERLQPINGLLSGEKVRNFLMQSQLPVDTLGKIWNLSDLDRDGSLDADEFAIALKLTSMAQKGEIVPVILPQSLVPSTKAARLGLAPPAGVSSSLTARTPSPVGGNNSSTDWVVTPDIKAKYDTYFTGIDKDHDGIVSGDEAKNLFMSSNLPHNALAQIWRLCDIDNNGRLNKEQFALAMFLIAERVKGKELPTELTPNMIPPSKRKGVAGGVVTTQSGVVNSGTLSGPSSTSSLGSPMGGSFVGGVGGGGGSIVGGVGVGSLVGGVGGGGGSLVGGVGGGSLVGGTVMSGSLLQPTNTVNNTSAPPSMFPVGGVAPPNSTPAISILQPTPTQTGSPLLGNKGGLSSNSASSFSADFSADFSAIRDLDTISYEIDTVKREKTQLQEDIAIKQELLVKGKEEVGVVQNELEQTTLLNQQLESQKKELQSRIEEVNNQRTKLDGVINELNLKCQKEKEEIETLQGQYKDQEVSITNQKEQVTILRQQLKDLQDEEDAMKSKIETSRQELMRIQSEGQSVQITIDQMKLKFDEYQTQQEQITAQLAALPPPTGGVSGDGQTTPTTMRVGELPVDFPSRNLLSEPDAVSARATAGSSSPVSSISGFSTASHLEEQQTEDRDRTDTLTTNTTDPFATFPDPFTGAVSGGDVPSLGGGGDFSSFDPFGLSNFNKTTPTNNNNTAVNNSTSNNTSSDFANFSSAFSSNFTSSNNTTLPPINTSTNTPTGSTNTGNSVGGGGFVANFETTPTNTTSGGVSDPFQSGSDPFSSDPFLSVTTPKASDQVTSTGWGGVSPFGSDPFTSTNTGSSIPAATSNSTSSNDPFFSTDPFSGGTTAADPFGGVNPFDTNTATAATSSGNSGGDPFASLTNNTQ